MARCHRSGFGGVLGPWDRDLVRLTRSAVDLAQGVAGECGVTTYIQAA